MKRFYAVALAAALSLPVQATNVELAPESRALLAQMQQDIQTVLLAVSDSERRAGRDMKGFHYTVDLPAQHYLRLGLVLDTEESSLGYRVLSVTPGSTADELNIQVGERITAINSVPIDGRRNAEAIEQLQRAKAGQTLTLTVTNDQQSREMITRVVTDYIPAVSLEIGTLAPSGNVAGRLSGDADACGEISFFAKPPLSQNIYPASIHSIDGDNKLHSRQSFRLPPGKHTVYVSEKITDPGVRRSIGASKARGLVIDVKPNTLYRVGAKFDSSKRFNKFKQDYWQPVVWSVSERECELAS